MPRKDSSNNKWDGECIKIESQDHYDKLLGEGYEVTGVKMSFSAAKKAGEIDESNFTLRMKQRDKQFIADANSIGGFVLGLQYLYDFQKKKPVFMPTPGGALSVDLEEIMVNIIIGKHSRPLLERQLKSSIPDKIRSTLTTWIESEKQLLQGGMQSQVMHSVFIVNERGGKVDTQIINKNTVILDDIDKLLCNAQRYDNSVALSFFYLSKKQSKITNDDDVLFGIILYDLKKLDVLCFNILSSTRFLMENVSDEKLKSFNFVLHLFDMSIDKNMLCKSFLPLPIDSPWYTALPWFSFVTLQRIVFDNTNQISAKREITIPEFFTFGSPPNLNQNNSFDFRPFSSKHDGVAICIMNFIDNATNLTYTLRFDQSKGGESLVHFDYSLYDNNEIKMIEHRPLNIESVYQFSQDLFVAIMCAGLCDSYFTTIIEKGLSGVNELSQRNPAFLYPLKWIWILDTAIIWLNQNQQGYEILDKLSKNQKLSAMEIEFVSKMFENHLDLVAEDENCNLLGLSYLGSMILQRHKRKMTDILMSKCA